MKLSTQTDALAQRFGDERAIRMLAAAGFDAIDYSMFSMNADGGVNPAHPLNGPDYREYARHLRAVADECGVVFNQAHAPFVFRDWGDRQTYEETILPTIRRSVEAAGIMGCAVIVVHPIHHRANGTPAQLYEWNMRFYRALIPTAEAGGVRVATENMWEIDLRRHCIIDDVCSRASEFNAYIDGLNSPWITGCLDLGHCGLVGDEAADMIRAMGPDRIGALHVHDNDYMHDSHTLPYLGKMDWNAITTALGEIGYRGDLTFEADNFLKGMDTAFLPTAVRFLHDCGRFLIRKIDEARG